MTPEAEKANKTASVSNRTEFYLHSFYVVLAELKSRKENLDAAPHYCSAVVVRRFGGYYGYSRWGSRGGLGVVGTVVLIAVVLYLLGALR